MGIAYDNGINSPGYFQLPGVSAIQMLSRKPLIRFGYGASATRVLKRLYRLSSFTRTLILINY